MASNSIWATRKSISILTIFVNNNKSISRQSDLAQGRMNRCQIISSALLRSSTPAGNGMRSLMAPTNHATAEVTLFLKDRFFIILLRPLVILSPILTCCYWPTFWSHLNRGFFRKRKNVLMWTPVSCPWLLTSDSPLRRYVKKIVVEI